MWGQLYLDKAGRSAGGWLTDSWSENGSPYWQCKFHWYNIKDKKLYHAKLNIGIYGAGNMDVGGEDTDIEPERAEFIRDMIAKWELEWLQLQAKP